MNIYTCNKFTGRWPVPVAAVIQANSDAEALDKLNQELKVNGLPGDADLRNIHLLVNEVEILSTGDY